MNQNCKRTAVTRLSGIGNSSDAEIASIVTQKTVNVIAVMIFNGSCHGQMIGSALTVNARKVGEAKMANWYGNYASLVAGTEWVSIPGSFDEHIKLIKKLCEEHNLIPDWETLTVIYHGERMTIDGIMPPTFAIKIKCISEDEVDEQQTGGESRSEKD